jgi:hypothetical protein
MRVVMVPGWQAKVRGPLLRFQHRIAGEVTDDARGNIIADGLIDTGDLLASVHQEGTRTYVGTDHWAPLEYGARPHIIRPNIKQALWWPGIDHPVAQVNHPGNREYAFMRRALYKKRG